MTRPMMTRPMIICPPRRGAVMMRHVSLIFATVEWQVQRSFKSAFRLADRMDRTRLRSLFWSHFLQKTGSPLFSGKCSNGGQFVRQTALAGDKARKRPACDWSAEPLLCKGALLTSAAAWVFRVPIRHDCLRR